jgi:hypothetical protein
MRSLSDSDLLAVWERGQRASAVGRALLLAACASPSGERDPADWPIGMRDAAIRDVYEATFGSGLEGVARCPACGERLEFEFDCHALPSASAIPGATEFAVGGSRFRLPTSRDLVAVGDEADVDAAAHALLRRCCVDDAGALACTEALVAEVEARIAALDEAADVRFALACASCGHAWDERFDIAAWCWDEVDFAARRLLVDVHRLASAYGWSEGEVLALGAVRRRAYLELIES